MWVETKRRVIDILKTLTAIEDTNCTVADYIPKSRSDHHGYLITVKSTRNVAPPSVATGIQTNTPTFIIKVQSPQINTGLEVPQEYYIEAYADAVRSLFDRYSMLNDPDPNSETPRQALANVANKIILGGETFQSPDPYAQGGPINHYSVSFVLQVPYDRMTGC